MGGGPRRVSLASAAAKARLIGGVAGASVESCGKRKLMVSEADISARPDALRLNALKPARALKPAAKPPMAAIAKMQAGTATLVRLNRAAIPPSPPFSARHCFPKASLIMA